MSRQSSERPYTRVDPTYWQTAAREQWSGDATIVGIYLMTSPHKTTEGMFSLPLQYILGDLPQKWTKSRLTRAIRELEDRDFVRYDWDCEVVLVMDAMAVQRPENPGMCTHAVRKLAALPPTWLWEPFLGCAKTYAPKLADVLTENPPDVLQRMLDEGFPEPLGGLSAPPHAPALSPSSST